MLLSAGVHTIQATITVPPGETLFGDPDGGETTILAGRPGMTAVHLLEGAKIAGITIRGAELGIMAERNALFEDMLIIDGNCAIYRIGDSASSPTSGGWRVQARAQAIGARTKGSFTRNVRA